MSDSIKVAIKVRPLIKREKDENSSTHWVTSENAIVAIDPEVRKRSDGRFEFDHIFDTNANNNDVFNVVKPIVDAAVNGFNGTVFAYGQTSSGKTYTMMGTLEEPGIVPLAVEHIFDAITDIPGREFLLRVSYLEIYNEKVNDLLNKNQDKNSTDLKVHEDVNGQVFVECKEEVTNSPENVLAIMNKGNKSRRIGETNMNERSSRSHTIFRITIESREADAGSDSAIQVSQLNMVDLAGSERARQTGATGERFKEGRHINLSLSTLALVIKQLSESQDYVNFRNSKLTRLLQTSLGGNAMTVMICAVTPAALDETRCTLSFASRARNVKNNPKLNEVMSDGVLLKRYAKQLDKLHTELERMKQLTQTTDFQKMESKIQEKDRINQNLEERIRLLQTRIITAANCNTVVSFKTKEKRRQTWCGTGGFNKLDNTSLLAQMCSHLSPIKEISPIKSHIRYKSDTTIDSSFQIAFADFELELMNSEANRDEDISSDEDPFVTYRDKHRVKFTDDVIVKSPINYSNDNITFDKIEASTQTVSNNSPDTPKHTLRDRIRNLTEEYSELKEFTTLEKQLHCEDHLSELQEKRSQFKKQLENVTSDKDAFEHIASKLRKKLTAAELQYTLAEDLLNVQAVELERIPDLEKKIAQLSAQKIEVPNVPDLYKQIAVLIAEKDRYEHVASELRKKLNEAEQRNIILEDKLTRNVELEIPSIQTLSNNEIISSEKDELQCKITDLQNKLITEAESNNNSIKDKLEEQQQMLQNLEEEKNIVDIDDLSITKMSLDDSAKLSPDLVSKNQELDEIKHIVQSLKVDIENLQQTVYLLTTENSELANKLATEKECNEKSAIYYQQTIDELYERNSKIMDEKLELENNLTNLNEQLETLRSRMPEINLNEEQIIQKYEKQISEFQARNIELLSHITDRTKELEMLKESKSLLYEHDCIYKDKLTNLTEKHKHLIAENGDLSTNLMDKIEENEGLKQECDILKNKLELSLKNKESIGNNDVEQLRMENTVLKTELMELKTNLKVLTEENSKISSQLIETIEDLDNARKLNSDNNTMHLSTLFNSTLMTDAMDKSALDDDAETQIVNLQEEVNHLTNLNRKLSNLKLGTCTQCSHLNELNENRRMLKLEVKTLNRKLENLQRKFSSKSAKSDALILKAKEDLNVSAYNLSLNASFSENMNVTCVEERLQSLNNELQILKEDHDKLSDLYKEKCNEVEELQNSTITDSSSTDDKNFSIKKFPSRTSLRLENIVKVMNDLQNDFKTIKENNESVKSDLTKFINEKERMLLDEINTLKTINDELLQKLSESELLHAITLEKADILENEVQDMTKKLQEFTIKYKEVENAKLLFEVEVDSLKEDKLMKEQTANELRQSHSCLEQELNLIKKEKEELNNDFILLEQEYNIKNEKLDSLKAMNDKLTSSKAALSLELTNCIKESENRLMELNEKINKCNSENDYLKQELIKLRDIENKFEKMKTEYQSLSQQDKTLADDNKKLKNVLNDSSKNIIKEIKSLEPKVDTQKFVDKSVDELFQIFMQTILMKEKEVIKTMRENFDKEKQKLEDEKRQSVDSEKRTLLWVKKLECEIEKLQKDLSEREIASEDLQKEITHLGHLLEESNRDREILREKNSLLETDLNNLQIEYNKYSKIDTANEEAIVIAQKREKQAQETIRNKESEFQRQLKFELEKEAYNHKRIENLMCTIELFKTKNMELTNSIEGLEVNRKQLKNIIDLKSNELMKSNQINQKMQAELEQLTETYNDLHKELEEKKLCIAEIKELLKTKCDELTEYKINLETIVPENKLLKQQISERKATIEQYKVEIETLKMENKKEIDAIKDQLNFEELKSMELNKQTAESNNKHMALIEEMNALRDNYTTLKHKCAMLEKRVMNSTSKAQAEEQMEELKDLNRSLRNNLDGASNRITELQAVKTDLMNQVITLSSQYNAACKDNQKLKETLSSSRHNDTYTACEKYDNLLQEKNKIALELEATKVQLNQKNKDIENYLHEIKELNEKNTELDKELDELAAVICEYDASNAIFQDKYYTCRAEADELQDKIKTLEKKTQINLLQTNTSSNKAEKFHDDECSCAILNNKIRELQLEVVSKNGKIATLELQIRSGSFPYQMKCKELQEHLSAYSNKNSELKAEIKRLQMAMIRISVKECDVCEQRLINRRHQACQTMPEILKFCGTSSGVIDDEIRITKLEKEKQIMRDVCRTRSKTIKELEKQIEEYEKLLNSKNS
ncbi:PREDICTED: kinesin-like protein KIN-7I [Trachymyrmex cornetzi]|uniref:Centromere-associated protein E n=1 Tax=Trachymyrmex cornetzi TaxID=471704 RepID=A0A151J699_9HYME|nr:PREDICTED: kinesin-like protein KIN-7I [Trachymyrmex cornetzi]KYN18753.1 Centromere-associated protein E [Trachymyrmex cornetzi]